jgi:hypothetical protein
VSVSERSRDLPLDRGTGVILQLGQPRLIAFGSRGRSSIAATSPSSLRAHAMCLRRRVALASSRDAFAHLPPSAGSPFDNPGSPLVDVLEARASACRAPAALIEPGRSPGARTARSFRYWLMAPFAATVNA